MIEPALLKKKINFDDSLANITIFGPGFGEAIVIFLPGLGWGIIDSCTEKIKKKVYNYSLEFLKNLEVKRLAFIILTHPHLDHYKGLSEIIEYYMGNIDRICIYSGEGLREYRTYLAKKNLVSESGIISLAKVFKKIKRAKQYGTNIIKISERTEIVRKQKYIDHTIEIIALSPSEDSISKYCNILHENIPKSNSAPISAMKDKDHNLVSSAIWCKIDNKIFIFGSDLEKGFSKHSGWNGVVNNIDSPCLSTSFVKVPHHGSPNAYNEKAWQLFSQSDKPVSVVTPYNSTKWPLPNKDMLKKISKHSKEVYVTSHATIESPKRIYKQIPLEQTYGINSWKYIKYPQQIGYVNIAFSTQNDLVEKITIEKPAFKM